MDHNFSVNENKLNLLKNKNPKQFIITNPIYLPKFYTIKLQCLNMHTIDSHDEGFSSYIKVFIQNYFTKKIIPLGETELKFNNNQPTFDKDFTFNFDMENNHNLIFEIFSIKNSNVSINISKAEMNICQLIKWNEIIKDLFDDDSLQIGKLFIKIIPNFDFFIQMELNLKFLITGKYKNKNLKSKFLIKTSISSPNQNLYESEMITLGINSEFANVRLIVPVSEFEKNSTSHITNNINKWNYFNNNKIQIEFLFFNTLEHLIETRTIPLVLNKLKNEKEFRENSQKTNLMCRDRDNIQNSNTLKENPFENEYSQNIITEENSGDINLGFKEFNVKFFLTQIYSIYSDFVSILNREETFPVEFIILIDASKSIFGTIDNYDYMMLLKEFLITFINIYSSFTELPLKLKFLFKESSRDIFDKYSFKISHKNLILIDNLDTTVENILKIILLGDEKNNFCGNSEICPEIEKLIKNENSTEVKIILIISDFSFLDLNKFFRKILNKNFDNIVVQNILTQSKQNLIENFGEKWKEQFYFNSNCEGIH